MKWLALAIAVAVVCWCGRNWVRLRGRDVSDRWILDCEETQRREALMFIGPSHEGKFKR